MRDEAHVKTALVHPAEECSTCSGEHEVHAGNLLDFVFNDFCRFIHRDESGAFGRGNAHFKFAFVHITRCVFLLPDRIKRNG